MTREEIKEIMPIIEAFSKGKPIQTKSLSGWKDTEYLNLGVCSVDNYRIKPEPTYRPFNNAEECWNEMLKHQPFGWVKDKEDGSKASLTCIDKDGDISINGNKGWEYDDVMQIYTFADGSVFGVEEEE